MGDDRSVRAVSLDVWGTLLGSDPQFKPARNALLRGTFAPATDAAGFDAAMRQADRDADDICMTRGRDVGFAERVQLTLHRLGLPQPPDAEMDDVVPDLLERQRDLALAHPPRPLHARLPELVSTLAARRPVVLTSNTGMLPGTLMRDLLRAAGFDGWCAGVFSNETGWSKPHERIFAAALAGVREHLTEPCEPRHVIHVGDHPRADVHGARSFGMCAELVAPDGTSTVETLTRIEGAR